MENVGFAFCYACRAEPCAQPSTCNRYIHGVHCVECGEFSDQETCRPCVRMKDVANRAAVGVRAAVSTAMAGASADAKLALQKACGERLAEELFQSATTKMSAQLELAAQIRGVVRNGDPAMGTTPTAEGEDLNSALAQLNGNAGISKTAVISMTSGLRQIASTVSKAASDSTGNTRELGDVSSAATKMVEASAKMENADLNSVHAWLKARCFARGFLARELMRDFLKQVARTEGLHMPRSPSESQVNEMVSHLSQEQIARLSKDLLAQVPERSCTCRVCW